MNSWAGYFLGGVRALGGSGPLDCHDEKISWSKLVVGFILQLFTKNKLWKLDQSNLLLGMKIQNVIWNHYEYLVMFWWYKSVRGFNHHVRMRCFPAFLVVPNALEMNSILVKLRFSVGEWMLYFTFANPLKQSRPNHIELSLFHLIRL